MVNDYLYLSDLDLSSTICTIRARVARLWDSINADNNEKFELNFQLLDEQGSEMRATAKKRFMNRIGACVDEGKVYDIKAFSVQRSLPSFRVVSGEYYMELYEGTEFIPIIETDLTIPLHRFSLASYDEIVERLNDTRILSDVCGLLVAISDKKSTTTKKNRATWVKEIKIQLQCGNEIIAALWGEKADLINDSTIQSSDVPTTIVLTSTIVRPNINGYKLSSTSATRIYLNLNAPETKTMIDKLAGDGNNIQPTQKVESISKSPSAVKETNINALTSYLQSDSCIGVRYCFVGKIMHVDDIFGWSYLSCNRCKGGAQKNGPSWWCRKCAINIDSPLDRYKLGLRVTDTTSTIKIIAFDKEAENLINHTVSELKEIAEKDSGKIKVNEIFNKLLGQEYTFFVKPTYTDFAKGGNSLAANKISLIRQMNKDKDKQTTQNPEEIKSGTSTSGSFNIDHPVPATKKNDTHI